MARTRPDGSRPDEVLLAGRYAVGEPIGRGRSTVHRGEDRRLLRRVAIKEVRLAGGQEDADRVRRRAMREAHAAARLNNPHVVTVYDVVEEGGSIWLVMELVDAPSLAQIVADGGPLEHRRAARIGLAVLSALDTAHAVGVVHRDVKPANVLVGEDDRAKLADFGVASIRDESQLTAIGSIIGSPAYMAPEQAMAAKVGPPADLWALGATLYYAVEGTPPFAGDSALATATAVVTGEPRPQQNRGPLTSLIDRLLAKEPGRRPNTGHVRAILTAAAATESPRTGKTRSWTAPTLRSRIAGSRPDRPAPATPAKPPPSAATPTPPPPSDTAPTRPVDLPTPSPAAVASDEADPGPSVDVPAASAASPIPSPLDASVSDEADSASHGDAGPTPSPTDAPSGPVSGEADLTPSTDVSAADSAGSAAPSSADVAASVGDEADTTPSTEASAASVGGVAGATPPALRPSGAEAESPSHDESAELVSGTESGVAEAPQGSVTDGPGGLISASTTDPGSPDGSVGEAAGAREQGDSSSATDPVEETEPPPAGEEPPGAASVEGESALEADGDVGAAEAASVLAGERGDAAAVTDLESLAAPAGETPSGVLSADDGAALEGDGDVRSAESPSATDPVSRTAPTLTPPANEPSGDTGSSGAPGTDADDQVESWSSGVGGQTGPAAEAGAGLADRPDDGGAGEQQRVVVPAPDDDDELLAGLADRPVIDLDRDGRRGGGLAALRSGLGGDVGRRRVVIAVIVVVALLVAGLGVRTLLADDDEPTATRETPESDATDDTAGGEETPSSSSPGSTEADEDASSATTGTTAATTPPAAPAIGGEGEVPADWVRYQDPAAGYVIAHPPGWQIQPAGGPRVDIRDPATGSYLRIDWTATPEPDPVADWREQASSFARRHQGYQEIQIAPYSYRDYNAAMWEFRYQEGGAQLHAANLGFVANNRGYALFFQTHEDRWAQSQDIYAAFRASFQPAP